MENKSLPVTKQKYDDMSNKSVYLCWKLSNLMETNEYYIYIMTMHQIISVPILVPLCVALQPEMKLWYTIN